MGAGAVSALFACREKVLCEHPLQLELEVAAFCWVSEPEEQLRSPPSSRAQSPSCLQHCC